MELLVVIAVIGAMTGLLMPAVQNSREAARLTECKNHLKQIGLATLNHHDALNVFPPARLRAQNDFSEYACDSTQASWLVRIMPYLELENAAYQWNLYGRFEDHDQSVREFVPKAFVCPSRRTVSEAVIPAGTYENESFYSCGCSFTEIVTLISGAVGDYGGNHGDYTGGSYSEELAYWRGGNGTGVIISSRPRCNGDSPTNWVDKIRMKDLIDGASHTALAGEMHIPLGRLGKHPENGPMYNGKDLPAFARIGGYGVPLARSPDDESMPIIGFGSWHEGICPFVMADGSVKCVDSFVDAEVLQSLCRREDAYEIDYSQFFF